MINNDVLEKISKAFTDFDGALVEELIGEAIQQGNDPFEILNHLTKIIGEMGEQFSKGELFLPELVMAGDTMEKGVNILKSAILKNNENVPTLGTIVLGTVKKDIHDIGKNIVKSMFISSGFVVNDLGVDVPPEKFVEEARKSQANIIALSTTMSTTIPFAQDTIEYFKAVGMRDQYKILVGGGSVTREIALKIGADGYGADAVEAVEIAKNVIGG
jgi:methanogenic corrinoid protein MtbC1